MWTPALPFIPTSNAKKQYVWDSQKEKQNREKNMTVLLSTRHIIIYCICKMKYVTKRVLGSSSNKIEVINWSWEKKLQFLRWRRHLLPCCSKKITVQVFCFLLFQTQLRLHSVLKVDTEKFILLLPLSRILFYRNQNETCCWYTYF